MTINNNILKIIFISFFVLFLSQCGVNIFNVTDTLNKDAGKEGDISFWMNTARDYYHGESNDRFDYSTLIMKNIIDYRWDELSTDKKFESVIFFTTIVGNKEIKDNEVFLGGIKILTESFEPTNLSYSDIDNDFFNNHLVVANLIHENAVSRLQKLVPYSNSVSSVDSSVNTLFVGAAFNLSYLELQKNKIPDKQNDIGILSYRYSVMELNYSNNLVLYETYTNTKADADYDAYSNHHNNFLCSDDYVSTTNAEITIMGEPYLTYFNEYIDNIGIPDIQLIKDLQNDDGNLLGKVITPILHVRSNFSYFARARNAFQLAEQSCVSGPNPK